jgi:hypothetical protein
MKKFVWLVAVFAAAALSLFTPSRARGDVDPEQWIDQTWVLLQLAPNTWTLNLSMSSSDGSGVLLPVGTVTGTSVVIHANNTVPPQQWWDYKLVSSTQSKMSGTILLDPIVAASLSLPATMTAEFTYNVRRFEKETAQGALHALDSAVGVSASPQASIFADIEREYKNTIDPGTLPLMGENATISSTYASAVRYIPWKILIPIGIDAIEEWLKSPSTPSTTPPPPAPAPTGPTPQQIADCKAQVDKNADHFSAKAGASACPPQARADAISCINLERGNQKIGCDFNTAPNVSGFRACGPVCP